MPLKMRGIKLRIESFPIESDSETCNLPMDRLQIVKNFVCLILIRLFSLNHLISMFLQSKVWNLSHPLSLLFKQMQGLTWSVALLPLQHDSDWLWHRYGHHLPLTVVGRVSILKLIFAIYVHNRYLGNAFSLLNVPTSKHLYFNRAFKQSLSTWNSECFQGM